MVSFLRSWLFLFIIILGEMLLTEIKITIKNTAEHYKLPLRKTDLTIHTCMFFEIKTVKPYNLKGSKREQFQGRCVSYFPPPFMFSFLGKFSVSLLTEVKGGFVSTAVAFSFHYYPW